MLAIFYLCESTSSSTKTSPLNALAEIVFIFRHVLDYNIKPSQKVLLDHTTVISSGHPPCQDLLAVSLVTLNQIRWFPLRQCLAYNNVTDTILQPFETHFLPANLNALPSCTIRDGKPFAKATLSDVAMLSLFFNKRYTGKAMQF